MKALHTIFFTCLMLFTFTAIGQTHIYNRYAAYSDLEVAYLQGFQLDNENQINVTIIIAKNQRAWNRLVKEFHIPTATSKSKKRSSKGDVLVSNMLRNHEDPTQPKSPSLKDNCFVSVSHTARSITIYHYTNENQIKQIIRESNKRLFQ